MIGNMYSNGGLTPSPLFQEETNLGETLAASGNAGRFVVLVVDFHAFANHSSDGVGAFGGRSEGDLGFLAVFAGNNQGLGGSVKGLEGAFVGYSFPASCEHGGGADGDHGDQCE